MRDEEIRQLLRDARARGDGAAWSRAAIGLARLGRWNEAEAVVAEALGSGARVDEALEALGPTSLENLRLREFELPGEGPCVHVSFGPDGRSLWFASNRGVWRRDLVTGETSAVVDLVRDERDRVVHLTIDHARGRVAWIDERHSRDACRVIVTDLDGRTLLHGRVDAVWGGIALAEGHVLVSTGTHARAYLLREPTPRGRARPDAPVWEVKGLATAVSPRTVGVLRSGTLSFHDPLTTRPRTTVEIRRRLDPCGNSVRRRGARRREWNGLVAASDTNLVLDAEGAVILGPESALRIGERDGRTILARSFRTCLGGAFNNEGVAASPTGRHLVQTRAVWSDSGWTFVDLERDVLLESEGLHGFGLPAWSPGGRRLAIPTMRGSFFLIEPVPAPPPAPDAGPPWTELVGHGRRFCARQRGRFVETCYRVRGKETGRISFECDDEPAAREELERVLEDKRAIHFEAARRYD